MRGLRLGLVDPGRLADALGRDRTEPERREVVGPVETGHERDRLRVVGADDDDRPDADGTRIVRNPVHNAVTRISEPTATCPVTTSDCRQPPFS